MSEDGKHTYEMMVKGINLVEHDNSNLANFGIEGPKDYFEIHMVHAATGTDVTLRTEDANLARLYMIGDMIDVSLSEPYEYTDTNPEV